MGKLFMGNEAIDQLLEYQRKYMKKDENGIYPQDQIDSLNNFFHSLKEVKLYHASPYDNIKELKLEQAGKSGLFPDVYASVSKEFTPVFLVHYSSDRSNIDTSQNTMNYSFTNISRIKEDNLARPGFVYEIDEFHKEFRINPNSKFGVFEVTCPHSVKIKGKEECNNPIKAMGNHWNFYQVDLKPYYAYNLCIDDYIDNKITKKKLEQFYTKEIATPKNKSSANAILNAPNFDKGMLNQFTNELKQEILSYQNKVLKEISLEYRIARLRQGIKSSDAQAPYKPIQDVSKVDLGTLKMYQEKKQNI